MRLRSIFRSVCLIAILAHPAQAQTNTCSVNGCGPEGWLNRLVPDNIRWLGCKFDRACNKHDKCYARCSKCGDLYKKRTCKNEAARAKRKTQCDRRLKQDILKDNKGYGCSMAASVYHMAVSNAGGGFFDGRELPPELVLRTREQLSEIGEFVSYAMFYGKQTDLKRVSETLDQLLEKHGRQDVRISLEALSDTTDGSVYVDGKDKKNALKSGKAEPNLAISLTPRQLKKGLDQTRTVIVDPKGDVFRQSFKSDKPLDATADLTGVPRTRVPLRKDQLDQFTDFDLAPQLFDRKFRSLTPQQPSLD